MNTEKTPFDTIQANHTEASSTDQSENLLLAFAKAHSDRATLLAHPRAAGMSLDEIQARHDAAEATDQSESLLLAFAQAHLDRGTLLAKLKTTY